MNLSVAVVDERMERKEDRHMDILVTTPGNLHRMLKRSKNCFMKYLPTEALCLIETTEKRK